MQLQIDKLGKVAVTVEQGYWSNEKDYDRLTIVEAPKGEYKTYISRKPVPAGTVLTNREYWIPFSSLKEEIVIDFNEFVASLTEAMQQTKDYADNTIEQGIADITAIKEEAMRIITYIADNGIDSTVLAPDSVTSEKIKAGNVLSEHIGTGEVKSANIGAGEVKSGNIGEGEVKSTNIGTGEVKSGNIGEGEIKEGHIASGAVTTEKLADGLISDVANITDAHPVEGSVKPIQSGGVQEALLDRVIMGDIVGDPAAAWEPGTAEAYIDQRIGEQNNLVNTRMNRQDTVIDAVNGTVESIQQAVETLNGNEVVIVVDHTLVAEPEEKVIYRQPDTDSYTDWMWDTSQTPAAWAEIATYSFPGIDEEPTAGSVKPVQSGGVASALDDINAYLKGSVEIKDSITLKKGYIEKSGVLTNATTWYWGVVLVKAGKTIQVTRSYVTGDYPLLGIAQNGNVAIGDTVTILEGVEHIDSTEVQSYTAESDTWIVISAGVILRSALISSGESLLDDISEDEPTEGSEKLVKSGSLKTIIDGINDDISDVASSVNNVKFLTNEKLNETGIDKYPVTGSNNVLQSGGMADLINGADSNYYEGYIDAAGSVASGSNYIYCDYIPAHKGQTLTWKYSNGSYAGDKRLAEYDAQKNFISGQTWGANSNTGSRSISPLHANTAYVRATFWKEDKDDVYLKIDGETVWTPVERKSPIFVSSSEQSFSDSEKSQIRTNIDAASKGDVKPFDTYVDAANVDMGYRLNIAGVLVADADWLVSGYIESEPSFVYNFICGKYDPQTAGIAAYDSDKNFIGYGTASSASTGFTTPAGTAFVRYCIYLPNKGSAALRVDSIAGAVVFEYKDDFVYAINERIANASGLTDIIGLNRDKESALYGMSGEFKNHTSYKKYIRILHFSDIHKDPARVKRLIDYANNYKHLVDCIVFTGDANRDNFNDGDNGWENTIGAYYDKTPLPFLPVIGNHDAGVVGVNVGSHDGHENTIAYVTERCITPYMERAGAVQGNSGNGGYWYKDFANFKIRIIGVNEYEMPRVKNPSDTSKYKYSVEWRYLSQTQVDWLVDTLENTPSDYSVIIATHQPIDYITMYDNPFAVENAIPSGELGVVQGGNLIQRIVDAFISKTTLTATVACGISGADASEYPSITIDADFTNASGKFVCYLNGHTHRDYIGQSSQATNTQVNVCVTASCCDNYSRYDDLQRVLGQRSEDAFNVISIDTTRKKIRILRIGADVTMNMTLRDMTQVDY